MGCSADNEWQDKYRRPSGLKLLAVFATLAGTFIFQAQSELPAVQQPAAVFTPAGSGSFQQLVAELSEPGGYFDTDNLISNERSYLKVIPELERSGIAGGVYLGVGPDQNFSYIARIRPALAIIVDIRRDNLLLHLLFKAIFANAPTRIQYLCLLTGRVPPVHLQNELNEWRTLSVDKLAEYVDSAPCVKRSPAGDLLTPQIRKTIARFGVPLSPADYATMARFYQTFVSEGLGLKFHTFGRPIQSYNPTYRELITETELNGRRRSFLASEDDYHFVRALQGRDGVIPVVGDFAGRQALPAIAAYMHAHALRLSVLYVSNVEDYLFRRGAFGQYMSNIRVLPHTTGSVVIRSVFGLRAKHSTMPGYNSVSLLQNLNEMIEAYSTGKLKSYSDLFGD
jgi:hypothetical protein